LGCKQIPVEVPREVVQCQAQGQEVGCLLALLGISAKTLLSCSRSRNEVMMILRRNPNFDLDALRRQFPDVNVDKLRNEDKIRGHYVPKVGV